MKKKRKNPWGMPGTRLDRKKLVELAARGKATELEKGGKGY